MDYELYLFSCLLKLYNKEFEQKPYDEQFKLIPKLYKEFEDSEYNESKKSTYEAILNYLKATNKFL